MIHLVFYLNFYKRTHGGGASTPMRFEKGSNIGENKININQHKLLLNLLPSKISLSDDSILPAIVQGLEGVTVKMTMYYQH